MIDQTQMRANEPSYDSLHHPAVAAPLGGIGTGNLAIGVDGGLRKWQLPNSINPRGDSPGAAFFLRTCSIEPPLNAIRILQSTDVLTPHDAVPMSDDLYIPEWQKEALKTVGGFAHSTMHGYYPRTTISLTDSELPVLVEIQAESPFSPHDSEMSGIPAAIFKIRITNTASTPLHGWLGATMHNFVGSDGHINPVGIQHPAYGMNVNQLERHAQYSRIIGTNTALTASDPCYGEIALSSDDSHAEAFPQFTHLNQYIDFLNALGPGITQPLAKGESRSTAQNQLFSIQQKPSAPGFTWLGSLTTFFALQAGESAEKQFIIAWYFPNRTVNFNQFGSAQPHFGSTQFWLGNHYATRFANVNRVLDYVENQIPHIDQKIDQWQNAFTSSTLKLPLRELWANQAVIPRSPTCFRDHAGSFFGFEGTSGASTTMWGASVGGSCPLNCTHVWNYEHSLSYLFPDLEDSMRETEYLVMQNPEGEIPHRVIVPTYLAQLWDKHVYGPEEPALDGMLGSILKAYRSIKNTGDLNTLTRWWAHVTKLIHFIDRSWNTVGDGILHGVQPSTHDIDLSGSNTYIGSLWLAALKAIHTMADRIGDFEERDWAITQFRKSSKAYDETCFNGEYFQQKLYPEDTEDFQWKSGCLIDQLIGQWWAYELDLGHIFPKEHIREAIRHIVAYNFTPDLGKIKHIYRSFGTTGDSGTLLCTWPHGGRPKVPTRYADEVWSGSEYQLAALCIREGFYEAGERVLTAVQHRHNGERRNPFNEVECGDNYVRAMAAWTIATAVTGFSYDAFNFYLDIAPIHEAFIADPIFPFFTAHSWGNIAVHGEQVTISVEEGTLLVRRIRVAGKEIYNGLEISMSTGSVHTV
ncbi:MAG: GH116 family glycosyl hydrolase [Arcanobacterium sp.]|nr:GH116 family glycosyl hydrolase [Arcanobacterium sp.]MDY5589158.1 GH116 family glycosyl-hydrolase [Arcanobacterium sp.]